MPTFIGEKYYSYSDENELNIFRVTKIYKDKITGVLNDKETITITDLSDYTLLKPAGYINFSVVELGDKNEDVITILYKNDQEISEKTALKPYAVCRQAVADVFANQILRDDLVFMVGTSVNVDNCPTNTNFKMLLACDKLKYYKMVACYIDDTIDHIINLANSSKFDETLKRLYNKAPQIVKQMNIGLPVYGFCKDLRELLNKNNFEYDFNYAFGIHKVDFQIKYSSETLQIIPSQVEQIEKIIERQVFNTYVVKYDYSINLKMIKRNHVLISDINHDIYIVAYDSGDLLNFHDKEQYLNMRKAMLDFKKSMSLNMSKI